MGIARMERFASIWLCLAEPFVATCLNAGLVFSFMVEDRRDRPFSDSVLDPVIGQSERRGMGGFPVLFSDFINREKGVVNMVRFGSGDRRIIPSILELGGHIQEPSCIDDKIGSVENPPRLQESRMGISEQLIVRRPRDASAAEKRDRLVVDDAAKGARDKDIAFGL